MSRTPLAGAVARRSAVSLLALALAVPAVSKAQDASADEAADSNENVIIVTAQKREQKILEIPVAISAIGQDTLQAARVDQFTELTAVSPSRRR